MKTLEQIIQENPGCVAVIDNDSWRLERNEPTPEGYDKWTHQAQEEWWESQIIVRDGGEYTVEGDMAGSCYGGDILQALANIVGITVTGV